MDLLPKVETSNSKVSLQVSLLLPDLTCLLMLLPWAAQGGTINLHPAPYSGQLWRLGISLRRALLCGDLFSPDLRPKNIAPILAKTPRHKCLAEALLSLVLDTNLAQTVQVLEFNSFSLHPNTHTITPFLIDYLGVMVLLGLKELQEGHHLPPLPWTRDCDFMTESAQNP